MMRALVIITALIAGCGVGVPGLSEAASPQGQRVVESRVVTLKGNQVMLHDGTTLTIPRHVADPTEIEQGDTIKFTYVVRDGRNVATSIEFRDRPGGDGFRRR